MNFINLCNRDGVLVASSLMTIMVTQVNEVNNFKVATFCLHDEPLNMKDVFEVEFQIVNGTPEAWAEGKWWEMLQTKR